jgi:xylulokinase
LNRALTGFTLPKLVWLKNQEPRNYKKLRHLLVCKDYIRFRLTGELATEVSDASGTLMFPRGKSSPRANLLTVTSRMKNRLPGFMNNSISVNPSKRNQEK